MNRINRLIQNTFSASNIPEWVHESTTDPLIYCTIGRNVVLRTCSTLVYIDMTSYGYTAGRLALHPVITRNQRTFDWKKATGRLYLLLGRSLEKSC